MCIRDSCNTEIFPEPFYPQRAAARPGLSLIHIYAACIVEVLCGPVAGGTDVQQVVRAAVHPVKGVGVDLDAKLMSDGGQVHGGVGEMCIRDRPRPFDGSVRLPHLPLRHGGLPDGSRGHRSRHVLPHPVGHHRADHESVRPLGHLRLVML